MKRKPKYLTIFVRINLKEIKYSGSAFRKIMSSIGDRLSLGVKNSVGLNPDGGSEIYSFISETHDDCDGLKQKRPTKK